jgi:hypothetical protein
MGRISLTLLLGRKPINGAAVGSATAIGICGISRGTLNGDSNSMALRAYPNGRFLAAGRSPGRGRECLLRGMRSHSRGEGWNGEEGSTAALDGTRLLDQRRFGGGPLESAIASRDARRAGRQNCWTGGRFRGERGTVSERQGWPMVGVGSKTDLPSVG